ncbi:hypothetical protein [Chelativorans sp.]|uniref:hypothetical protein n=1 Tax=Chelativorans sp. TaxID=2203393 RepID=UPI002810EB1A|nr:hypothetical protein [Chelativorans sp.]
MRKLLIGLVSGTALLGLAACGDTDDTTTQSVEPGGTQQTMPPAGGDAGAGGGAATGGAQTGAGGTGAGGAAGTGGQ